MARITIPGGSFAAAPTINVFEEAVKMPSSISWRSVLAGVTVALCISIILNLIGMAIGFSTVDPATGDTPSAMTLSVWAAIWYVMTAIAAAFAGGWVASYLSNRQYGQLGGWHGLVTWAVSTLIMVYLVSAAMGSLVGSTLNAVGGAAQTAAIAAAPATMNDPLDDLDARVSAYSSNDARALSEVTSQNIRRMIYGQPADVEQLRAQAVAATMRANNMTEDQARQYVAQLEQDYRVAAEKIKAKAAEAAEATSKGIARISIVAALTLIFGALAGWMGGNAVTTLRRERVDIARV
ncbi:MAG: PhnA-like protein [Blastochloris viridis]|uniref:PhnA-like protein n=1 Tax=Blastochloris viridis TaxID=1079 RepID=A0A6N4RBF8_BLAVI|nr:MAG: PhnA-like protein [Blastochloris viridis]